MISRIVLAPGVLARFLAGFFAVFLAAFIAVFIPVFLAVSSAPSVLVSAARAQDVPGIEICTVEKTMERRTSCLQSNIDFLQKTIAKLAADHAQKLDAANRQIEGLKAAVLSLQKIADELQAAQKKTAEDLKKKADAPPAKDGAAAKDGGK